MDATDIIIVLRPITRRQPQVSDSCGVVIKIFVLSTFHDQVIIEETYKPMPWAYNLLHVTARHFLRQCHH